MLLVISLLVAMGAYMVVRSLSDHNRRIPSFSTPEGKKARVALFLLMAACLSTIVALEGGDTTYATHILLASVAVFVVLLLVRQKDKKHGKATESDDQQLKYTAVAALVTSCVGLIFWYAAIPGVAFSIEALRQIKHKKPKNKNYRIVAIIGLTAGLVAFLLPMLVAWDIARNG